MTDPRDKQIRRLASETVVLKELLAVQDRTVIEQTKRLESATRAALAASEAKAAFLANMSHEIRTPMNAVVGMTGLMLDGDLPDKQRKRAEVVRNSANALLRVINDILDFSKIEASMLTIEPVHCDLEQVAEQAMQALAPIASDKKLELILRIAPDLPRGVVMDDGRVRQILTNLVGNGIKFTSEGYVAAELSLASSTRKQHVVQVDVTDTGVGIADEQLHSIFDSFTQADETVTRRFGGTGLGLTISKQLVELMGGTIGVESTLGTGTTFTVTFPVVADPSAAASDSAPSLSGIRAMVVDDVAVNRELLQERLEEWGFLVTSYPGGEAALAGMRKAEANDRPYQFAIVDHQMPGMSGVDLGVAIRRDPAGASMHLIILSSDEVPRDARFTTAHFSTVLQKPLIVRLLGDAIRRALTTGKSARAYGEQGPEAQVTLQQSPGTRALVVDDVDANRMVGSEMLEAMGCRVDVAADGREAIAMLETLEYDIIFMDCQMPHMDGFEATRVIRDRETTEAGDNHIPIVAMTAAAMESDRQRCLDAGMDDYISKPIDIVVLNKTLIRYTAVGGAGAPTHSDRAAMQAKFNAMFVKASGEQLGLLREAIAGADPGDIQRRAHALRGACGTLATPRIIALTRQIEDLGEQEKLDDVPSLFAELAPLLAASQASAGQPTDT